MGRAIGRPIFLGYRHAITDKLAFDPFDPFDPRPNVPGYRNHRAAFPTMDFASAEIDKVILQLQVLVGEFKYGLRTAGSSKLKNNEAV